MEVIYDQAVTEQEVTALLAIPRNAWIRRTMPNLSDITALARIPETKPGLASVTPKSARAGGVRCILMGDIPSLSLATQNKVSQGAQPLRQSGEQLPAGLVGNAPAVGVGLGHQVIGGEGRFHSIGWAGVIFLALFRHRGTLRDCTRTPRPQAGEGQG